MLKWQRKKQREDQKIGLVFRWRRARRHHVGKLVALVIIGSFFLFLAYAVKVDTLRPSLLTKRTGEVIMLNANSPENELLLMRIEDISPFPDRWDPAFDSETMKRVEKLRASVGCVTERLQPELVDFSEKSISKKQRDLVEMKDLYAYALSPLPYVFVLQNDRQREQKGKVSLNVRILADQGIHARLQSGEIDLPIRLNGEDWYGRSYRFLIGVESSGIVKGCVPLSRGSVEISKPTEKQKLLAAWLRQIHFKRADKETVGVIELQIEAIEE